MRRLSSSARAGVRVGDVLIACEGAPVRSASALRAAVEGRRDGSFTLEVRSLIMTTTRRATNHIGLASRPRRATVELVS